MQVDCPDCGASLAGTPGAEMVCPACMTPFLVPSLARAVRVFDVQPAGDAVLHGLSRHAIREAIYVGRFDASAKVRHDGGKWELIGGYPEFAAVFRLLGGDLAPMAGTRKLAGWGRGRRDGADADPAAPKPSPAAGWPRTTLPVDAPLRSPTLVPGGRDPTIPPTLPAATAPATAAALAAVADAESSARPAPVVKTLPAVEEAPSRVPIVVGGVLLVAAIGAWIAFG
ncbi:MAG: hypothetical protein ACK4YP_16435 [Myxococcota bacterium]